MKTQASKGQGEDQQGYTGGSGPSREWPIHCAGKHKDLVWLSDPWTPVGARLPGFGHSRRKGADEQCQCWKPDQRSLLERMISVFAEVKSGERILAIIMSLNIFLILNAYYVLKPIRDSLITNAELFGIGGDELASYLAAGMAFLLIFFVRAYAGLASRVNRIRLLNITTTFIVACVLVFFFLLRYLRVGGLGIAIAYFVWVGMINFFIIAQFWSYANDLYSEKTRKALFAFIAIGQSTGAILGASPARSYGEEYTYRLLQMIEAVRGSVGLALLRY